jgi:Flp pilus assembly protein TadD
MLLHTAVANSIGNNFDLQGAAGDAEKYFRKLLALNPEHPQGNMRYGAYLAGTNRGREALPYLLKAQALGVREASYTLGLTWLILGDKAKALENLERYQSLGSRSARIDQLIAAVRSGKGVRNEMHE